MIAAMRRTMLLLACALLLAACRGGPGASAPATPPARVEHAVKESELSTITLSPQTEERLGITVEAVSLEPVPSTRLVAGEVIVPSGMTIDISAPVAGTLAAVESGALRPGMRVRKGQRLVRLVPLLPADRDLRADAERDVATAAATVDESEKRAARAERLFQEGSGSRRSQEEAQAQLARARAALAAAEAHLATVNRSPVTATSDFILSSPIDGLIESMQAVPGQSVAAAARLLQIVRVDRLWVRVPVYAGDTRALDPARGASVLRLGDPMDAPGVRALPVNAPPFADPLASAVDLTFELPDGATAFQAGERVMVRLAGRGETTAPVIAESALLHDIHGGLWVYERTAPHVFTRQRVEVEHTAGGQAVLARGPQPGAEIVTAGAAELYGIEFGAGK